MNALPGLSRLPDPRRYGVPHPDRGLAALIEGNAAGEGAARLELIRWLNRRLAAERDADIFEALRHAPSAKAYRRFWERVCEAAERTVSVEDQSAVVARTFAFPLVFVTASHERVTIPGVLPDIAQVRALLERHGALGTARNFGIGNALCDAEALGRVKPSAVYRWSKEWTSGEPRELPSATIVVRSGREQVYLRFLAGASISAADAPSFLETASNIAAWGLPLTRALTDQLVRPGLSVLVMPRPPAALLKAAHGGRRAELEAAYNLFVSNAARDLRATIGDPSAIVSAHRLETGGAELRVSLSTPLDDTLLEGFRWPLHPADDLDHILRTIAELLEDCRIHDVSTAGVVLPERTGSGALFLRARDVEQRAGARH